MPATAPALRVRDLHAHYGASHVLHGVTLDAPAAAVTALVGRNGVGKTTFVNTVMGLVPATGGSVVAGGAELIGLPVYRREGLGLALVPQGRRLFRSLTVEEHLALVGPKRQGRFPRERIFEFFPRLRERRTTLARNLSGGEQSMLAIARALTSEPRILLMDEPTEGLAPLLVETVRRVIAALRDDGLCVLLVEQRLAFALAVADRIAVMERGAVGQAFERDDAPDVASLSDFILGRAGS